MLTRREMLIRSAAASASVIASSSFARSVNRSKAVRRGFTLRVLGTHVTLQEQIRLEAEHDLGFNIEFVPGGSASVLQQASTRPDSFHVYEQWSNSINILWRSGAIKPLETERIKYWSSINPVSKTGRLNPTDQLGAGDSPNTLLYVQPRNTLGSEASDRVSYLPYVHNVDSFGYDTRHVPIGEAYQEESWAWLLDDQWRGRVATVNEPTIGLFDLALAAQAKGLMSFSNIGNMTVSEIDQLFEILIDLKRDGHFTGVWNSVPESVNFMNSGRAVIESMFSPGASALRADGVPVRYAAPKEGYRAWHGVLCLSSEADEEATDAAYAYMNWWLSGKPGAVMARQGYYISVSEPIRSHLSEDEWAYWYAGEPARTDLHGPDGRVIVRAGEYRNGGSYSERFSNIAVWNTVMDNYEYSLTRWGEFLSTEAKG